MPHSQGLSNNSYPEPNQSNSPDWYLSLQGHQSKYKFIIYIELEIAKINPIRYITPASN